MTKIKKGQVPREMDKKAMKSVINDWKKLLSTMSDENIHMKNRLSILLKENFDTRLLPKVENLHSHLLEEDGFINLLRHNIGELDSLIETEEQKNRSDIMASILQSQILTARIRLSNLKSAFNDFFLQENGSSPSQIE